MDFEEASFGSSSGSSGKPRYGELNSIVEEAVKIAADSGHASVTVEHLVLAVLGRDTAVGVLVSEGVDADALRTMLLAQMASWPRGVSGASPEVGAALQRVIHGAVSKGSVPTSAGVTWLELLESVLSGQELLAASVLRDCGFNEIVAQEYSARRYGAERAEMMRSVEALNWKINEVRAAQQGGTGSEAMIDVPEPIRSSATDVASACYKLSVVARDSGEPVRFKGAVSRDGQLDLYIEYTPFEVAFNASRIAALFEAIEMDKRLQVSLSTVAEGEQRHVAGFTGEAGAIFEDRFERARARPNPHSGAPRQRSSGVLRP